MSGSSMLLARKYARAWQSVISVEGDVIDRLERWARMWTERSLVRYLRIEMISNQTKQELVQQSALSYGIHIKLLSPLLNLLQQQKRLWLVGEVAQALVEQYYQEQGIADFEVSTVDPLTSAERALVEEWIRIHTGIQTVRMHLKRDVSLIAGIRIEGAQCVWEHSVRSQLSLLEKLC